MIGAMVYKLAAFFAGRLPQDLSESITEWLVRFQYAFRFRSRRIIRTNLRMALGKDPSDREIHRLARRTFSNFGRSIYYFLRLPSVPRAEIKRRCEFNGIETITQRLVGNGGCIFVGPHLGAWETGGACLSALGVKLFTVALPHPSRQVTHFFNQQRAMLGIECCSPEHSANRLRGILREGKCVALLVDRVCGGRAASFRWFDKKVELPVGHLALAVRCDVPVVTTACVFDGKERFKFIFGGPHYPKKDLGHSEAMMDLQEKCLADMTDLIRRYPDQWFHFQPFGGGTNGKGHERHS
jgi:lauroyl/myristoyl acyltransferase